MHASERPLDFNRQVANIFSEFGRLLRSQDGNPFRVNAYLRAASTLEALDEDVRDILREQGTAGLMQLPTIGSGLASSIEEIARTGRLSRLERLRGESDPVALFRSVPGIGNVLARRIHDLLHLDTLEGLELAAYDGRLESVPGIGGRRLEAVKAGVASRLNRSGRLRRESRPTPAIETLLDVDTEYRQRLSRGELPKIAPKRFNPEGKAWLPVLHTERPPWHFTALYSNTALAHELDRNDDWVVIYFYDDDHQEGQCTVVTETQGDLRGRRIVRGRENECYRFYSQARTQEQATP